MEAQTFILDLRRQKQVILHKFKASLVYLVSCKSIRAGQKPLKERGREGGWGE